MCVHMCVHMFSVCVFFEKGFLYVALIVYIELTLYTRLASNFVVTF